MSGQEMSVFPTGEENAAFAPYFIGQSYLNMLSVEQVVIGNVTFEPKCRNNWHIHHADKGGGQMLLVTAGEGWYQEWGKPARKLKPGDVVHIPAEVKHWHGAAAEASQNENSGSDKKVLVVYFSATGNTKEAAGTGNWLEGVRFSSAVSEETVTDWVRSLGY